MICVHWKGGDVNTSLITDGSPYAQRGKYAYGIERDAIAENSNQKTLSDYRPML